MTIDPDDLATLVQRAEMDAGLSGDERGLRVLRELLWLAQCRLSYTESGRTTELKAIRHAWARIETRLGVD